MIQNMRMVTLVKLVKIANLAKTVWTILAIIVTRHNLETSFWFAIDARSIHAMWDVMRGCVEDNLGENGTAISADDFYG